MHAAKRRWLQVGLGVPEGSALVRTANPRADRKDARDRVLVVGGRLAIAMAGPLQSLASLSRSELTVDTRAGGSTEEWIRRGLLLSDLEAHRPTGVILATKHDNTAAGQSATAMIVAFGSKPIWVSNGDELPGAVPLLISSRELTARQLASLSAAAWLALG